MFSEKMDFSASVENILTRMLHSNWTIFYGMAHGFFHLGHFCLEFCQEIVPNMSKFGSNDYNELDNVTLFFMHSHNTGMRSGLKTVFFGPKNVKIDIIAQKHE